MDGGAGFLQEAALAFLVGEVLLRQDLQGDEAAQAAVPGLVDPAHAARPDLVEHFVARYGLTDQAWRPFSVASYHLLVVP